jgi:hypothetical protein
MVQAHSPGAFFPLSNQRVTLRSQLQLQVYSYGQCGQHLWFCLEFEVQLNVFRGIALGRGSSGVILSIVETNHVSTGAHSLAYHWLK